MSQLFLNGTTLLRDKRMPVPRKGLTPKQRRSCWNSSSEYSYVVRKVRTGYGLNRSLWFPLFFFCSTGSISTRYVIRNSFHFYSSSQCFISRSISSIASYGSSFKEGDVSPSGAEYHPSLGQLGHSSSSQPSYGQKRGSCVMQLPICIDDTIK